MRNLETVVTYLEMTTETLYHIPLPANIKLMLLRAENITIDFYRFLYATVGKSFEWNDRADLTNEELLAQIHGSDVDVWVAYVNGQPAGYFELAPRDKNVVELEYFGLIAEFRGRGLGKWLLAEAVRAAWAKLPQKVIVQTCTLDGPRALPLYQKMGFTPYAQEQKVVTVRD